MLTKKALSSLALIALGLLSLPLPLRAQCHFTSKRHQQTITYRFQPEATPYGLVLHVTFEFRAGPDGTATLIVPTGWAGEKLHAITGLRTLSRGASLAGTAHESIKLLHARPNRKVLVAYDLHKDWTGPLIAPFQFHPVILSEFIEFTGNNALVHLQLPDGAQETANFDWRQLPPSWILATSFGTTTTADGRCQTFTGSANKVNGALYSAASDFRIHHFLIDGKPAILAARGTWTFPDDEAIADIQKTVSAVRGFWHDNNFPYFLVTLAPYDQDHGSSDGSAFTNAFWMFVSRKDSISSLLPQLAHESFHAWDPGKMGSVPSDYHGGPFKWFSEGATEYYAQLLTYRAGQQSAAEYVRQLNVILRRFPTATDEYVRGRIISLWLDGAIRSESHGQHSLDDVMFDMVRTGNQPFTLDRILATADRYLSPDSQTLLQRAILHHGDLPAPAQLPVLGACAHASLQNVDSYDLGFDFPASRAAHALTGVATNGPAFKAGLRNGQRVLGYSIYNNDSTRLATITISTADGPQKISYYPGGQSLQVWQYRLIPNRSCLH